MWRGWQGRALHTRVGCTQLYYYEHQEKMDLLLLAASMCTTVAKDLVPRAFRDLAHLERGFPATFVDPRLFPRVTLGSLGCSWIESTPIS